MYSMQEHYQQKFLLTPIDRDFYKDQNFFEINGASGTRKLRRSKIIIHKLCGERENRRCRQNLLISIDYFPYWYFLYQTNSDWCARKVRDFYTHYKEILFVHFSSAPKIFHTPFTFFVNYKEIWQINCTSAPSARLFFIKKRVGKLICIC